MATTSTKPGSDMANLVRGVGVPDWPRPAPLDDSAQKPTQLDALQALIAFSSLHDQVRRRKALAARHVAFDSKPSVVEFEPEEQFLLDEVLQLVAERAVAITGADGLAIALAENNEIVLRAAAGTIRPDLGARIDRDSAFSGACFRTAQIFNCDDTEVDTRVNVQTCRKLGARSMVAVPLCGRRRVIGVLEAFSSWPFGFNDSDVQNLTLLAELILAALKPEDEDRFAQSAQIAATNLDPAKPAVPVTPIAVVPAAAAPTPSAAPIVAAIPQTPAKPASEPSTAATTAPAPIPVRTEIKPVEAPPATAEPVSVIAEAAEPKQSSYEVEEPTPQRPWKLIALICIVVVTAFGAGVWWKLKTAQIGSAMVHSQESPQPQNSDDQTKAHASSPGNASSITPAGTGLGTPSDGSAPGNSATPQELSKFPHVTGVRHWSSADTSTVVLDLEDQVQYEPGHLPNPDRFYFDLRDTQLAPELEGKSFDGDALLSRIRIAQPSPGITRIVLEARSGAALSRPQVSLERDPYRLVIEISKAGAAPKGAINLFPNSPGSEPSKLAIVIPPPTKEDLLLRAHIAKMRIVVDAGHGGWDLGTVGRRGLLEKDLVLEIAQRLGKLLESRLGADVIYTRQDDNYIPLDDRAQIANQSQADLFVSVHANYSDLPSARGVETYYTNFFSAPGTGSKEIAMHAGVDGAKNNVPTLSAADLHDRIEQSRRLAASVQRSLYGALSVQNPGLRDRGIREAGFVVLTESAMPGILAEVSFVSSPTDEQKLRSEGYREQIAEALYKGIARYAANSHGVKMASASK
jgi:N-acetylmuramoyl-L-alanine amidase/putative methionine-R-sulfoxide reductase with GAF domain